MADLRADAARLMLTPDQVDAVVNRACETVRDPDVDLDLTGLLCDLVRVIAQLRAASPVEEPIPNQRTEPTTEGE